MKHDLKKNMQASLFEVTESIASITDLISPFLQGHHKHVAYIVSAIGRKIALPHQDLNDVILAALLHDCGALSLKEKLDALNFDVEDPHGHAEVGYRLLKDFPHFKEMSLLIRYHHSEWKKDPGYIFKDEEVPFGSYLLHLADRIDVLIDRKRNILDQVETIRSVIKNEKGKKFHPELVEVFHALSDSEAFWLEIENASDRKPETICFRDICLDYDEILGLTKLIERLIDFRSRYTSTHSRGVAVVAEELARIIGLPEDEVKMVKIAGCVHDIGKLAIPVELIEKPGKLTKEEYDIVKKHALHTYQTLKNIKGFETISEWAAFHHERLNGEGYPFRLEAEDMPIGARIIGIADVFTAITEDRPYRKGIRNEETAKILCNMADNNELDPDILSKLRPNIDRVSSICKEAQMVAMKEYEEFFIKR